MFAYVSYDDENMISFSFPKSTTQSQEVILHRLLSQGFVPQLVWDLKALLLLLLSQGLTCQAVTCCPRV